VKTPPLLQPRDGEAAAWLVHVPALAPAWTRRRAQAQFEERSLLAPGLRCLEAQTTSASF
jgi:hypothetical protein